MSVLCGIVSGGILLLLSPIITNLLVLDDTARHYLEMMLLVCTFYMISRSINDVVIVGIFNAGGDTKFDAISVVLSTWLFAIPLAAAAAFWWEWPVLAVYIIISLDEFVKIPWVYRHYKKYKWVKDITSKET